MLSDTGQYHIHGTGEGTKILGDLFNFLGKTNQSALVAVIDLEVRQVDGIHYDLEFDGVD